MHACFCNTVRQLLLVNTAFQIRKIAKKLSVQLSFSEEQTNAFVLLLCTLGLTPALNENSSTQEEKKKHTKSTEAQGAFLVRAMYVCNCRLACVHINLRVGYRRVRCRFSNTSKLLLLSATTKQLQFVYQHGCTCDLIPNAQHCATTSTMPILHNQACAAASAILNCAAILVVSIMCSVILKMRKCDRIWQKPPYGTACAIVLQAFFIAYGDNIVKVIFLQLWLDKP